MIVPFYSDTDRLSLVNSKKNSFQKSIFLVGVVSFFSAIIWGTPSPNIFSIHKLLSKSRTFYRKFLKFHRKYYIGTEKYT